MCALLRRACVLSGISAPQEHCAGLSQACLVSGVLPDSTKQDCKIGSSRQASVGSGQRAMSTNGHMLKWCRYLVDTCVKQKCRAEFGRLNLEKDGYLCSLCKSSMKSQQWDATGRVQVCRSAGKFWSTNKEEHSLEVRQKSWVSFERQVRS